MFGEFVKDVRRSRGLSLRQLAESSGVSKANISAIEHGRRVPSAATLNRLVVACGYELAAVAGERLVACPFPPGLFPDDDLPPAVEGDPVDEEPALRPGASPDEHRRALVDALSISEATARR